MRLSASSYPPVVVARASAVVAIVVAGIVLCGWHFDVERMKAWAGGLGAMNPATSVAVVLASCSLLCLTCEKRRIAKWADALALLVLSIGGVKLGDLLGWWNIPFDLWLYRDQVLQEFWDGGANRMPPTTALAFMAMGGAVLSRHTLEKQRWAFIPEILLFCQGLLALISTISYLYGARSLSDFGGYLPMSLPAALVFLALMAGTICALPESNLMRLLVGQGEASLATRRLLLAGVTAPLFLGWLTLQGQQAGYYSPILSIAIFCVATTFCFAALALWNGVKLVQMQNSRLAHEKELRESEERFRLLSNSAFEALAVSVDGVIVDVNQEFCRNFGYDYEEVKGMLSVRFVPPEFKPLVGGHVNEQPEQIYVAKGLRKDGSSFDMEVWGRTIPLQGKRGRVTAIRDITERCRVERMKDEFISVVNHELRTPLTSIYGALGLVANGMAGPIPPAALDMTQVALRNSKRLLTLINDLLDVQKIEAGKMTFSSIEFELKQVITSNVEAIASYAASNSVTFETDLGDQSVMLRSDPDRLGQVLTNLLSNAAKFSPCGGVVTVKVIQLPQKVRVEIHDGGKGIPVEFQSSIFEKFSQADSSSTRRIDGTGLGLSICKSIMEHLGGCIGFETGESIGTTFHIELPLEPRETATPLSASAQSSNLL